MGQNGNGRSLIGAVASALVTMAVTAALGQTPPGGGHSLPAAVLKAFRQAYPGATITASSPQRSADRVAYRVESLDKGRRRIVVYDAGGAAIEVAEQVAERELPAPVAAAMRSHRRAIYVTGMKVTRQGTVQYELTLRGTRKTALVAKPDGTVVSFR